MILNEQEIADVSSKAIKDAAVEGIKSRFNIKDDDITKVNNFLNSNKDIKKKFESCKSINDIMKVMKSKDFKEATKAYNKDKEGKGKGNAGDTLAGVGKFIFFIVLSLFFVKAIFNPEGLFGGHGNFYGN